MRILICGLGAFLLWAIPTRYWYVCKIKNLCHSEAIAPLPAESLPVRAFDLTLLRGDSVLVSGREQFLFPVDSVNPVLTDDNRAFLEKIASWMKTTGTQDRLSLTGAWRPSETERSSGYFENLGLARAAKIREMISALGIEEERIALDHMASPAEDLALPMAFVLHPPGPDTVTGGTSGAFTLENMSFTRLNFAPNSARFDPPQAFVSYADSLQQYFVHHPDKAILITGHTDAIGPEEDNQALGQRRADAVKNWLVAKGIRARMETRSAGEKEPVADNKTEEGRARNRRVNLTIE